MVQNQLLLKVPSSLLQEAQQVRKKIIIVAGILVIAGASVWGAMWLREANMNWEPADWR